MMSEHDDAIREALAAERAAAHAQLDPEEYEELIAATDAALEARPSLVVRGEEELAKGLANAGVERGYVGGEAFRAHVARRLIASGDVRVAPSLVAASREALLRTVREATAEYFREDIPEDGRDESDTIVDALLAGPVQVVEVSAEQAWVSALEHVWELNDPAYSILPDTASRLPLVTEADVRQAKAENPYVGNSRKEARG